MRLILLQLQSWITKATADSEMCVFHRIWSYIIQLCDGLAHLHRSKILHRDLKPANCFLVADGTLKIGDLNVSKLAKQGMVRTQIGTPYYMSPEIYHNRPYDDKSDMWAVGCILYELAALKPPFRGKDIEELSKRVQVRWMSTRVESQSTRDPTDLWALGRPGNMLAFPHTTRPSWSTPSRHYFD